jgi:hypothetical protein
LHATIQLTLDIGAMVIETELPTSVPLTPVAV